MQFHVVIHKDAGAIYGVTAPDLPGCFSGGETLEEAMASAREAIAGHIATLIMYGQPIPGMAPPETHQANEDYAGGLWAFVDCDLSKQQGKPRQLSTDR